MEGPNPEYYDTITGVDQMRKDAARYRWLMKSPGYRQLIMYGRDSEALHIVPDVSDVNRVIDAAMEQANGSSREG